VSKHAIPKATPTFTAWAGQPIADTYNGKQVLSVNGKPAFAELAILWALQSIGWDGVWIDTYSRVYRTGYWDSAPADLPAKPAALLERIQKEAGSRFGAWDVFCCRGDSVLFAESKRAGHDKIRDSQVKWLEAAMRAGFSADDFLIVEWSLESERKPDYL
jgi:hypothetical protein